MDDVLNPGPTGGATDEDTKRHNNLRRDILTSLLEVDQTIKGLEHCLMGRFQEVADNLQSRISEAVVPSTPPARCEFDPVAMRTPASEALREQLAPLSAEIANLRQPLSDLAALAEGMDLVKDNLSRLLDEHAETDRIAPLREEIAALREMFRAAGGDEGLRDEVARIRTDLQELRDALGTTREDGEQREMVASLATEVASLRGSLGGLREEMLGIRDLVAGLKDAMPAVREASVSAAESTGTMAQTLVTMHDDIRSLPAALRGAREETVLTVRENAEEQITLLRETGASVHRDVGEQASLLREIGGKVLEELSLLSAEARKTAASAPETEARLLQQLEAIAGSQESAAQTLSRIRDLAEEGRQAEKILTRIRQVVEAGETSIRNVEESNRKVVEAFETYHTAAREEAERIRRRQAQEQNGRGVVLYYRGSPGAAEAAFRKALETDPENAEIWNNLGLSLSRQDKSDEAVAAFEQAIRIDPKMGEVYNNLGFLFHTTLQYDRAVEMFNRTIQTESDSAVAYTNLGNTYYKLNRHDQAVAAWKRALELDPLNENARRCLRMYQQEKP